MSDDININDPVIRGVLGKIASGESPDYNTIFGGQKFSDYSDHPRIPVPIPEGNGKTSSAAGRYQMLGSTWDHYAAKLGLPDFSPPNQDKAAWDDARVTYAKNTGRDLYSDASSGKVAWGAMGKEWPSLAGKPTGPGQANEASSDAGDFEKLGKSIRGQFGQTGNPNIGESPNSLGTAQLVPDELQQRMLQLQLAQSLSSSFRATPVNYDPFAIGKAMQVQATPIEYDPFGVL